MFGLIRLIGSLARSAGQYIFTLMYILKRQIHNNRHFQKCLRDIIRENRSGKGGDMMGGGRLKGTEKWSDGLGISTIVLPEGS